MYCNNCGAQNPEGSSFCSKCGSSLTGQNPSIPPEVPAAPARKTDGLAVAALVLGIVSFLPPFMVCSIPAIVMGAISMNRIKKDPSLAGKGMAMAGLICGSAAIVIWICLIIIGLIFAFTTTSTSSGVSVSALGGWLLF